MLRCSDVRLSQTASTEQAPGRAQRRAEGGGPVRGAVGTDVPRVDTAVDLAGDGWMVLLFKQVEGLVHDQGHCLPCMPGRWGHRFWLV